MGMATVAAYTLVFLATLLVIGGIAVNQLEHRQELSDTMEDEAEILEYQLGTDIRIVSVNYAGGAIEINAENDGKTVIDTSYIDIVLDNQYIPRTDRTIIVDDFKNSQGWDPGEYANITISKILDFGTYNFSIISEYGSIANATFTSYQSINELLSMTSGQFTPPGGAALDAGQMLAINNDGGTDITLEHLMEDDPGFNVQNPSESAVTIQQLDIIVDYDSNVADGDFAIEARNDTFDGELFCSNQYNSTAGEFRAILSCEYEFDSDTLRDLYVYLTHNATGGEQTIIDYVAVNTTYSYQP